MGFWDGQHKRKNRNTGTGSRKPGPAGPAGSAGVGFNLTPSGDYDMKSKKLVNCGDATADKDAVNKKQMETYVTNNRQKGEKGEKGNGFNLTPGGDYDMSNKKLVNCADGTADKDVVNKKQMETYVTNNRQKGDKGEKGNGFNLTPGGDYDMSNKRLVNCADGTADKDVVNKKQMETYVTNNRQPGPAGSAGVGFSLTPGGDYDMKSKKLVNCGDATANKDAVNKQQMEKYVDDHLSHSISTNLKNDFRYVMYTDPKKNAFSLEEDIKWGGFVDKNLHNSVKYTAKFILTFDGANGYYSSRLGVDMHPIPVGEYTLVCEMLWDSKKIDKDNVGISATSSIETVSRQRINKFDNHVRSIIHFHKWNNPSPPNDLQLDIHMKNKLSQAYDSEVSVFIVIYGSKGYHNDIPTSVWETPYFIEKGVFTFTEEVAVPKPVNPANPVTKYHLEKYIDGRVPRKIWYQGSLAHNNSNIVNFYVNGTLDYHKKVHQSYNLDFTVNSGDTSKIYVKNAGMYMVSYTDDIKTDSGSGLLEVVISSYNTFTTDGKFGYHIEATYNRWRTKNYCFMVYFSANDWMQIKTSNSRMHLGKQANFNRLMMIKLN